MAIKFVDKSILKSNANIIVVPVDCTGELHDVAERFADVYSHLEKTYIKYVNKCEKGNIDMLGKVQYVPTESWAMIMVDPMKNKSIEAYDKSYQYVANAFIREVSDDNSMVDLIAVRRCLLDVESKASSIGATIAIPKNFSCGRNVSWDDVMKVITQVFGRSNVDVEICKYNGDIDNDIFMYD